MVSHYITDESEIDSDDNNVNINTEIFENYSSSDNEPFQDQISSKITTNSQFLWIVLWILSFCRKFNILEIATEFLIKFVKLLLTEIGSSDFNRFPSTLYSARNAIGLKEQHHNFAVCSKYNKLYNKKEVKENLAVIKCNHIEFLNLVTRKSRSYQMPLSEKSVLFNNQILIQTENFFHLLVSEDN